MKKKEKGYSLVEVLVAMTILIIGVLPIISMFPQVFSVMQRSTENEERARIALQVIEYIKIGGYPRLRTICDSATGGTDSGIIAMTPVTVGSKTYKSSTFELKFITPAIYPSVTSSDYFRLSSKKGMDLGNTGIFWVVSSQNMVTDTGVTNYTNFIVGSVIVGTGRDVGSATLSGREKETKMQFIVTPIE